MQRIVDVLMALREGEVTTYGDVADVAGYRRQARHVGWIVKHTDADVPWWRVVNSAGVLRAGDVRLQAQLLGDEGVIVRDGRVVSAPIGRFAARPTPSGQAEPRPGRPEPPPRP